MTSALTYDAVANTAECFRKLVADSDPVAVSCNDELIVHEVQPDEAGRGSRIKVAMNGIAHLRTQLVQRLRLSENRLSQRTCREATFRRILDYEDHLAHRLSSAICGPCCHSSSSYRIRPTLLDGSEPASPCWLNGVSAPDSLVAVAALVAP